MKKIVREAVIWFRDGVGIPYDSAMRKTESGNVILTCVLQESEEMFVREVFVSGVSVPRRKEYGHHITYMPPHSIERFAEGEKGLAITY